MSGEAGCGYYHGAGGTSVFLRDVQTQWGRVDSEWDGVGSSQCDTLTMIHSRYYTLCRCRRLMDVAVVSASCAHSMSTG